MSMNGIHIGIGLELCDRQDIFVSTCANELEFVGETSQSVKISRLVALFVFPMSGTLFPTQIGSDRYYLEEFFDIFETNQHLHYELKNNRIHHG